MTRLVLGLDIGVTSVGYGIIDLDSNMIVDCGVRLFKEGTAANNETRRDNRSGRRLRSRRCNRRDDLKRLFLQNGLIDENFKVSGDPYTIWVKGLSNKLSNDELATALFHLCKHRGNSLETADQDEKDEKLGETKKILKVNDSLLKEGYFVCEIQKKNLNENGKIRGSANNFRTKDYVAEIEHILSNQDLNENLKEEIVKIITRRRNFSEGPGSEKSPTQYGQWFLEDGTLKHVGMIEKMRGKCSIYPNELRAPKMSYSADLFNLLNDLNNLSIKHEKITKEQKEKVIEVINKKGHIKPLQLAKLLGVEIEEITGFRIDKNDKPILTEFNGYKKIKKIFSKFGQEELLDDKIYVDKIIEVLSNTKILDERKNQIKSLNKDIDEEVLSSLAELNKISGYHSLSFKAIYEMNTELLNTELNQMQILQSSNIHKITARNVKGNKKIYADDSAILSPVAKRAQREAMKVINRLREIYGEFDSIVVETAREKNSEEQKKKIKEDQKYFELQNKRVQECVGDIERLNAKQKEKIRLCLDQDSKCAYTLAPIDYMDILDDPYAYEVDHIIPISVSLDDSYNNKVLVTHTANQGKGNLTPIAAFDRGKLKGCSKSAFITNAVGLRREGRISGKKLEYLLFEKDITKYDVMKQFINRNLVDTSYANRVVFNTLSNYFKQNNIDTNVHTIKGSATHQFRRRIKLRKDRDEDYSHHAIDAIIVASLKKQPVINNLLSRYNVDELYNHETGEVYEITSENAYFDSYYIHFLADLKNLRVTKFSHKIDTKPNRQIADETIYSTRMIHGEEKVIKKYKDIYDPKFMTLAEDILNNVYQDKYLMFLHDEKTFCKIIEIVMDYYEKYKDSQEYIECCCKRGKTIYKIKGSNPLALYKEEFGMIRKYSKKGNGPFITQMKYIDSNLGNHLPITHKYATEDKKIVLLQLSPYRTDFYRTKEGLYKFVTVRYKDISYSGTKNKYVIDNKWYNDEKVVKGIDNNAVFEFSMHHDELIGIVKEAGEKWIYNDDLHPKGTYHDGINVELLKFTATNNDKSNSIEVKPIHKYESKQLMSVIGKKVIKLKKFTTDVLGNVYEVKNSILKLEF